MQAPRTNASGRGLLGLALLVLAAGCSKEPTSKAPGGGDTGTCVHEDPSPGGQPSCTVNVAAGTCAGPSGTFQFAKEEGSPGKLHCFILGFKKTAREGQAEDDVRRGDVVKFTK